MTKKNLGTLKELCNDIDSDYLCILHFSRLVGTLKEK